MCRTDRCCWEHDRCYDVLQKKGSNTWMQYYKYRYSRGVVTCGKAGASRSGRWKSPGLCWL